MQRREVRDVRQRFDPQEALRLDEPQEQHHGRREPEPHQHEQIARAPGRKHVDDDKQHAEPRATGMIENGYRGNRGRVEPEGAHRPTPMPMSTGAMKMMTIHDADPTVRAKRVEAPRRHWARHEGRRSSDRKNVDSDVTTPLNARNARKVRNNHDKPSRSR